MSSQPQSVLGRAALEGPAASARGAARLQRLRAWLATPGGRLDLLGLGLALCYGLPALFYPHGNDQALHWYVGQGILLGKLPFVSAVSAKPVGIFAVHALCSLLFGPGQAAIRIGELLTLGACAALVARITRPSGVTQHGGELGLSAIVLFGLYYTYFDYWDTSHPELWEATFALAAAVAADGEDRPLRRAFWVGLLSAASLMFKHTAVLITLPIAGYVGARAIARRKQQPVAALLEVAGPYALGSLVTLALCVLPFAFGGGLHAMWEVLFSAVLRYASKASGVDGLPQWICLEYGGSALITAGVGLVLGRVLSRRRGRKQDAARTTLLLGLTVAALASVWIQYRFYSYHFVVAAPWLAACIVWGLRVLWPEQPRRAVAVACGLVAVAFAAGPWWCSNPHYSYRKHFANLAGYLAGSTNRWDYLEPFLGQNRLDHYRLLEQVGQEVKRRARPGDTLCVRGFAAPVYQVSGLRCPSRHVIEARAALPGWKEEYERVLREHPPTFIVTFRDRPKDVGRLRRRGYRALRMRSLFVLMIRPERAPDLRPRPRRPRRPHHGHWRRPPKPR